MRETVVDTSDNDRQSVRLLLLHTLALGEGSVVPDPSEMPWRERVLCEREQSGRPLRGVRGWGGCAGGNGLLRTEYV